jgi:hypothetical protein
MADLDDVVHRLKQIEKEIELLRSDISSFQKQFGDELNLDFFRIVRAASDPVA